MDVLIYPHETHRATSRVADVVTHGVGTGGDVESVAGGAVDVAGGPVVTHGADIGGSTAGALSGSG